MKNKTIFSIILFTIFIIIVVAIKSIITDVKINSSNNENNNTITNNTSLFNASTSKTNTTVSATTSNSTYNTTTNSNSIDVSNDTDVIEDFEITANTQRDGSVDFIYSITWKVLDDSIGYVDNIKIGLPTKYISGLKPLSYNISGISVIDSTYANINFNKEYKENEVIKFTFRFNCDKLYSQNSDTITYSYTPGWFNDIAIQNLMVRWESNNATEDNSIESDSTYFIWKQSMHKGEKMNCIISYPNNAFSINSSNDSEYYYNSSPLIIIPIIVILFVFIILLANVSGGSYSSHRGFGYGSSYGRNYGGIHSHSSSSSHRSSCASSHSRCACACACAGGGRAGCSKKDFYGTKLNAKKIIDILKK